MSTDPDRDPALAAVWREHSTEAPPPHVDAAILAAAHREAASGTVIRSRAARAWRWWVPLATAAVIAGIVVGVRPPEQTFVDDAARTASDVPAARAEKQVAKPATEPKVAAAPTPENIVTVPMPERKAAGLRGERAAAAPKEERAKSIEPGDASKRQQPAAQSDSPKPQQPAAQDANPPREGATFESGPMRAFAVPPPAPSAAPIATPSPAPAAASMAAPPQSAVPAGTAPERPSAAPAQAPAPAARADREIASSAEVWIARIRAFRERGESEEAMRELARFRDAYPDADARLPADLREWAKAVR